MTRGTFSLAVWTGLIAFLVLPWASYQDHSHWQRVAWLPLSPPVALRDIAANLLLYAPWGYFLLRSLGQRARNIWMVAVLAAALSLITEASQLYSHRRYPSATDLACNIIGACAGAMYARRTSMNSDR